jgi:ribosomal protein L32
MNDAGSKGAGKMPDKQSLKVPHLEVCPECGVPLASVAAKGLCHNEKCPLYRTVIENCCGD